MRRLELNGEKAKSMIKCCTYKLFSTNSMHRIHINLYRKQKVKTLGK